jgi:hypothetical protein
MSTVKIAIMSGVLAVGLATVVSAQGWSGCCGGVQPAAPASSRQGPGADAALVCPDHGMNCSNVRDCPAVSGSSKASSAGTVPQGGYNDGCRHWYRSLVPGHRNRCCDWNGNADSWNNGRWCS